MRNDLWFIASVCMFVLFIVKWQNYKSLEPFESRGVIFLTKEQTYNMIMEDKDGYITNMDESALRERATINRDDYKRNSAAMSMSFLQKEVEVIAKFARLVDLHLVQHDPTLKQKITEHPWKFALTSGIYYELGQPHIREGVIFMSDEQLRDLIYDGCQLASTLHYLRMVMLFPPNAKNATSRSVYLQMGSFPKNWMLPTCRAIPTTFISSLAE